MSNKPFDMFQWLRDWALKHIPIEPDRYLESYYSLRATEWSHDFEDKMRNRLVMGAIRYGKIGSPRKPVYDRLGAILKRAKEYEKTGNDELLVDIANFCLLEYCEGTHPNKHFKSVDDGKHVEEEVKG